MEENIMSFRNDFLWGGAVSAAQCEGGWDEDGKSPVEPDYLELGLNGSLRQSYYQTPDGDIGHVEMMGMLPK